MGLRSGLLAGHPSGLIPTSSRDEFLLLAPSAIILQQMRERKSDLSDRKIILKCLFSLHSVFSRVGFLSAFWRRFGNVISAILTPVVDYDYP